MKIVSVEARDVYVTMDMSLQEINYLMDFLDKSVVEYNGDEEPEMKKADSFIKERFFPMLNQLTEELKHGSGTDSPGI